MNAQSAFASHPLSPPHCADRAVVEAACVVAQRPLARDTYRLRLRCPEIARRIVPGQFVMLRDAAGDDPLLGRPFAPYDLWREEGGQIAGVDVVYLVVGRATRRLARLRGGEATTVWGPLGNGFATTPTERLVMVAGGIGQTPFLTLGREALAAAAFGEPPRPAGYARQVTLCYGVRSAEYLAGRDDFAAAGFDLRVTSDDGSVGRHGRVTEALAEVLEEASAAGERVRIACCGPEPMMAAVARLAIERNVTCEASLETPMACGIGVCFSCVAKVRLPDGGWDYKRTCVEGPVFDAAQLAW